MAQKTITVPAAGSSQEYNITGCSIIILQAPLYDQIGDEPQLSFNSAGENKPVIPGAVFNNGKGGFNRFVITGTSESAGDIIKVYISNDYLTEKIPLQLSSATQRRTASSISIASTDAVQEFTEIQLANAEGDLPVRISVSCTGNDIKFAFDVDPVQGDGRGTVIKDALATTATQSGLIEIEGINFILAFRFRSATAGNHGTLTVHREF